VGPRKIITILNAVVDEIVSGRLKIMVQLLWIVVVGNSLTVIQIDSYAKGGHGGPPL